MNHSDKEIFSSYSEEVKENNFKPVNEKTIENFLKL